MATQRRNPRARVFPRPKRGEPARIELNILRLDADGNSIHDGDIDQNVCDCFPQTSSRHIPSMLYDHINCPHNSTKHIQPAQNEVFAYPWTANTVTGRRKAKRRDVDEDSLASGRLSNIAEENYYPTPNVTRTAPPFAEVAHYSVERTRAPFSAPGDIRWENYMSQPRRAVSVPSLTGYVGNHQLHVDPQISTPYVQRSISRRPGSIKDRHFDGHYIDPKDGHVYKFKVKYGQNDIKAKRFQDDTIREEPEETN
ncbi:hypothetical protein FSP39_006701 [Pinctada imbricata]|uniref:Uncharacterized protein n=1 Tax=Pinctada imbricata TaxID=66713 RepID=A0AA88XVU3_PINIB|nr:hypothetical protein FSP39_006701 [Pinctada imbricata]